jgi:hypothetical protein
MSGWQNLSWQTYEIRLESKEGEMIIVLLLGFTVGVILALTGAGGGILAVPLLVFGVGLSMAEAGPIGLLAVGLAATLGAVLGLKNGTVRYKAALLIAGAGIVCSPFGLWLAQRTPNRPLTIVFAFVLMYVAFRVFQRSLPASVESKTNVKNKQPPCLLDASRGKLNWTAIYQFDSTVSPGNVSSRYCAGFNLRSCRKRGDWAFAVGNCFSVFHWSISRHDQRASGRRQAVGASFTKRVFHCVRSGSSRPACKSYLADRAGG